jgi:hypothetical protein
MLRRHESLNLAATSLSSAEMTAANSAATLVVVRGRSPAGLEVDSAPYAGPDGNPSVEDTAGWPYPVLSRIGRDAEARHVIATESGHYVLLQQPELVIDAIQQFVEALRDPSSGHSRPRPPPQRTKRMRETFETGSKYRSSRNHS